MLVWLAGFDCWGADELSYNHNVWVVMKMTCWQQQWSRWWWWLAWLEWSGRFNFLIVLSLALQTTSLICQLGDNLRQKKSGVKSCRMLGPKLLFYEQCPYLWFIFISDFVSKVQEAKREITKSRRQSRGWESTAKDGEVCGSLKVQDWH